MSAVMRQPETSLWAAPPNQAEVTLVCFWMVKFILGTKTVNQSTEMQTSLFYHAVRGNCDECCAFFPSEVEGGQWCVQQTFLFRVRTRQEACSLLHECPHFYEVSSVNSPSKLLHNCVSLIPSQHIQSPLTSRGHLADEVPLCTVEHNTLPYFIILILYKTS